MQVSGTSLYSRYVLGGHRSMSKQSIVSSARSTKKWRQHFNKGPRRPVPEVSGIHRCEKPGVLVTPATR